MARGLDRSTGLVSIQPTASSDARNVYARDDKISLRPGLALTGFPQLAWGTDLLATVGVKATSDVLLVVYDRPTRELRIYRLDTDTGTLQTLLSPVNGSWGFLSPVANFPVVTAAESNGLVFFAHDEQTIEFRLPTIYYTAGTLHADVGTLTTLSNDLDGSGVAHPVYARGVFTYLEYLVMWGYGSFSDPDHGEIARLSKPLDPTNFLPPNYIICGVRKDPIIGAVPVGNVEAGAGVLVFGKENSMFRLVGNNFNNFTVQLHDDKYGFVSARVAISVGTEAFTWSADGARQITLGGSQPIAQRLELVSPLPDDFPILGPTRSAFASYDHRRYLLSWVFPDPPTARVPVAEFALSMWTPTDRRWTFILREQPVSCAGLLISRDTGQDPAPPTGYVSGFTAEDNGIATVPLYRIVRLNFTNNGQTGAEIVQLLVRKTGDASWSVATAFAVGANDQVAYWTTALPVAHYEVALRYLIASVPATGYDSSNPDTWTSPNAAGSKSTVTTSTVAPIWTGGAFISAAVPVTLTWSSDQQGVPYLLEKDIGAGYVTVAADLVANSYVYTIPAPELGLTVNFRLTAQRGATVGPSAGVLVVPMFITIGTPTLSPIALITGNGTTVHADIAWSVAANATSYLLESNPGTGWVSYATVTGTTFTYYPSRLQANTTVQFRVTGKAGATSGATSAPGNLNCAVVLGAPTITSTQFSAMPYPTVQCTIVPGVGPVDGYFVFISSDGGATYMYVGGGSSTFIRGATDYRGKTIYFEAETFTGFADGVYESARSAPVSLVVPP